MSGRTCALRTKILQDKDFLVGFATETWRGHLLKADDDNLLYAGQLQRDGRLEFSIAVNARLRQLLTIILTFYVNVAGGQEVIGEVITQVCLQKNTSGGKSKLYRNKIAT